MMDVTGRTAAVIGASGGVGEGISRALLAAGATVVTVGRSADRLRELAGRLDGGDRVKPLVVDLAAQEPADISRQVTEQFGLLDLVVVSVGAAAAGRPPAVLDITDEQFLEIVTGNELASLRALRAFVPVTAPHGAVVGLVGLSGEVPFPQNPLIGASNAGIRSLLLSLGAQLADRGPRIQALTIGVVRTRARQAAGIDHQDWLTGDQVGERIIELYGRAGSGADRLLDPASRDE